jgi:hypothetical protein
MASHLAPTEPDTAADRRTQDASYYRGILHDLIDRGADLARLVHEQAKTQAESASPDTAPDPAPAIDAVTAFERIARAVRRSILLAQKLDEPVLAPAAHAPGHRQASRRRIIRAVEDTIQRHAADHEAASLHAEFLDRLDSPDLDEEIEDRPVAEIIADICRDLGLAAPPGTHPWKRRTPADIATLCARAAASAPKIIPPPKGQTRSDTRPATPHRLHSQSGCRSP